MNHAGHIRAMTIMLNGAPHAIGPVETVAGLLAALGLETRKVAVERNEEIVPRSAYETTLLAAGDAIEIVHFIGGG
jgi:thiamine biosynthesis protein ThiS